MAVSLRSLLSLNPPASLTAYVDKSLSLLRTLSTEGSLTEGTVLHGHLIKKGLSSERFIAVKLLILYLNHRRSREADQIRKGFDGFDLVVQNCLINANFKWGELDEARCLFDEMPERNEVSWTAMISGLMSWGRVRESIWYFERNPFHNVVSWTAGITGMVQNGLNLEALHLFRGLLQSRVRPNSVTFTSTFRACVETGNFRLGMSVLGLVVKAGFEHSVSVSNSLITLFLRMGEADLAKQVFDLMEERDTVTWTAILDMYVESGDLARARRIFDEMPKRNEVSWSAMIARYVQNGLPEEALRLFSRMIQEGIKPSISCFSSIICALSDLKDLRAGTNFHAHVQKIGVEPYVFISTALIDLYCKCGNTGAARLVFDSIPSKNVVCWNSMISGYSLNGQMEEAEKMLQNAPVRNNVTWNGIIAGYVEIGQFDEVFEVVNRMLLSGEVLSKFTFSSVLCACSSTASLEKGKNFHAKAIKLGFLEDVYVGTGLTDMYAKCGDMMSSRKVFDRIPDQNEFSWTVIIQGLAENGFAKESIELFEEMEKTSSITPNELMLLSVLFACSHSGLVDTGLSIFNSMETRYGVKPCARHYTCVVDMLSRSGRLSEAEAFIDSMKVLPEGNAWAALLSACTKFGDEKLAKRTARKLSVIAEKNSAAGHVLLSNMYASLGKWAEVMNVRRLMREKGLKKSGGCSWIENSTAQNFIPISSTTYFMVSTADLETSRLYN
ncbi:pentatricopeptide repeat-containing protein At1g31430-like isoform X2 [Punica granatum]|uniref:Pentatricopeptide repeat-containing protein At1g31430-like isoform X2 n=1 Tax=Punica granatum TaxID=22663 RepID=A0A218WEJ9_PUNGR|nr:pentatricopeptide repeat-containing protein At1g31430-like isoform X2 [Punica granatum]OWM70641.1 hypothetical protein CDL15_Pgr014314 [Punica granatum]